MESIQRTAVEELRSEQESPSVEADGGVSLSGIESLHGALGELADGFDVRGFKCTECGLAHMHDTTKHRASDTFDVSDTEAAQMKYNGNCHCGYNEAAHTGMADVSPQRAADTAPIPDETAREMRQAL